MYERVVMPRLWAASSGDRVMTLLMSCALLKSLWDTEVKVCPSVVVLADREGAGKARWGLVAAGVPWRGDGCIPVLLGRLSFLGGGLLGDG